MNDQTDRFAELNRKRVQGELSEVEYARQKSALMDGASETGTVGNEQKIFQRSGVKATLLGISFLGILSATYLVGKSNAVGSADNDAPSAGNQSAVVSESDSGSDEAAPVASAESNWTIQTNSDPMTDATVVQAVALLKGNQFDAEVKVSCDSQGQIKYVALSLDKEGKPAEMRSEMQASGSRYAPIIRFQMRADDKGAVDLGTFNPAYNNQVILTSGGRATYMGQALTANAEDMASASQAVLRLFMLSGEETYRLNQADPGFRAMVEPCLSQFQARRDRELANYEESARAAAVESANNPAPTNAM